MVKVVCKIINLSLPNLACFAPWRESIPALEYFRLPETLRKPRKLSSIVIHAFSQTALAKKRFALSANSRQIHLTSPHRIRHAGMDCRHPGPQGCIRIHPC